MLKKTLIKNGDMPSKPMGHDYQGSYFTSKRIYDCWNGNLSQPAFGMTKREEIAMRMMANLIGKDHGYDSWFSMASDALDATDALLEAMERTK